MRVAAPSPSTGLYRLRQAPRHGQPVQRRDQAPQLSSLEARFNFDPMTARQQHAHRTAWPRCALRRRAANRARDMIAARLAVLNQFHRNQLLRASRLPHAPPSRIQRMHAQPVYRAEFLAPHPALLILHYQALSLRPASPMLH